MEDAAPKPFSLEPDTLEGLLEQYVVENKVPAREPGCMLMLTSAKRRDGSSVEMLENQKMKLWLVSRLKEVCHLMVLVALPPQPSCQKLSNQKPSVS